MRSRRYPNISRCGDKYTLYKHLTDEELDDVEHIIQAYNDERIDFEEPRTPDGEPDWDGEFSVIIKDPVYLQVGGELVVMKWYEDMVDTEHLIDCIHS